MRNDAPPHAFMTTRTGDVRMIERGRSTKGRVARALSGAEAIEIKVTVPQHQIRPALKRFGLTVDNDEQRYIYFFDTPSLDLMKAGVIVRARRVVGDAHDSTVKFRPVVPEKVSRKWTKYRDFKIEADASEKGLAKSASFSMPVASGLIKRVATGKRSIQKLFTPEQQAFLKEMTGRDIDFSKLAVLGPITAYRWRFETPACPWPISAELWRREDGALLVEASIKSPAVQAAAAVGGFMAFLAEVGAERDNDQQTKTRWALEYYAAKLDGGGTRKTRAKRAAGSAAKTVAPAVGKPRKAGRGAGSGGRGR
jgi:hypothetical protein